MNAVLNIKVWTIALGSFLAVSFTLCVLGGLILPGLPTKHVVLEAILPGFEWISLGAFALGLAESFFFGAYAGLLFALLHNYFSRRIVAVPRAGLSITKVV
jgi:hypothetical protein